MQGRTAGLWGDGQKVSISVEEKPLSALQEPGDAWQALLATAAPSFFQSEAWQSTWLKERPGDGAAPLALLLRRGGRLVGAGIFAPSRQCRHRLIRTRGLHLGEWGRPDFDALTIEYNGLLSAPDDRAEVARALAGWFRSAQHKWDELYLPGLCEADAGAMTAAAEDAGLNIWTIDDKHYDYVDLAAVREADDGFDATLSRNSRYQIRRSAKAAGGGDALEFSLAASTEEGLDYFARLKALHQASWQQRGRPGAFANPVFESFHRRLIGDWFAAGVIQLCRLGGPAGEIGYLYNFCHEGYVYGYQSGFNYALGGKVKPGLTTHYYAIKHSLDAGMRVYDFMAGAGQHKASLGTHRGRMRWLVLQRPRPDLRLEQWARRLKGRLRQQSERDSKR